jgi:hypothetical protein
MTRPRPIAANEGGIDGKALTPRDAPRRTAADAVVRHDDTIAIQ